MTIAHKLLFITHNHTVVSPIVLSFSALEHLKPEDYEEIVTSEFAKKLFLESGDQDIFNSPDYFYMAGMIEKFPTIIIEVTLIYQFSLPLFHNAIFLSNNSVHRLFIS